METFALIRSYAWIVAVLISLSIIWLTFTKMKGTIFFKICFGVFRAIIFFAIFYNPLMTQPRIDEYVVLPIVSISFLIIGILLNVIGTKELVQTKAWWSKGYS